MQTNLTSNRKIIDTRLQNADTGQWKYQVNTNNMIVDDVLGET